MEVERQHVIKIENNFDGDIHSPFKVGYFEIKKGCTYQYERLIDDYVQILNSLDSERDAHKYIFINNIIFTIKQYMEGLNYYNCVEEGNWDFSIERVSVGMEDRLEKGFAIKEYED